MRTLSIPMMITLLNDDNMPKYLAELKKAKADRVFLCIGNQVYREGNLLDTHPETVKKAIDFYKDAGLEVGIWINAFGHGGVLAYQKVKPLKGDFTPMEGINGDTCSAGFCPLDPEFRSVYFSAVTRLAEMGPDIIMLDDDFRMNNRPIYMACFCRRHLERYYEKLGERIPREEIEEKMLTGGNNKYRTAYFEMLGESLEEFARLLREKVDAVNENIRLGCCVCYDNMDEYPDPYGIALAFAGKTKPFIRTQGAPYWNPNIISVIESTRMELAWFKNDDMEIFTEGDAYPRPRYKVEAKRLENFDIALIADGSADGILKYMIDYTHDIEYEKGYIELHARYEKVREEISEIFEGKTPVGVYSYNALHKAIDTVFSETFEKGRIDKLFFSYKCASSEILSKNSIPTSHRPSGYPLCICGESARQIDLDLISDGALLDISAAEILSERGLDVGLLSSKKVSFVRETFKEYNDFVPVSAPNYTKKIKCAENAEILSFFEDGSPSSYRYENKDKKRFNVLAFDIYGANSVSFSAESCIGESGINYYRQEQIRDAVEWIGGKKLPAFVRKSPNLYILSSKGDEKMSVLLMNHFMDEVFDPVVELDKSYSEIRFVNCSGRLEGDKVYLDTIPAYGVAAFEIK